VKRALALGLLVACGGGGSGDPGASFDAATVGDGGLRVLGPPHTGQYQLGPVEWTGSFTNACEPYPDQIRTIEGGLLAGLDNSVAAAGDYCDACVYVETGKGHHAVLRVVTYGVSNAPGDMDVSKAAFDALTEGEYPRAMTWRLVECPTSEPLYFQYQTQANPYWTSLWVRNPRQKIDKVEVKSAKHASYVALRRGTDGTLTDDGGFGDGAFTLRITGVDGAAVEQAFPSFTPGAVVAGSGNLP
jgi:expansin (peptidoglycan-binding protein)